MASAVIFLFVFMHSLPDLCRPIVVSIIPSGKGQRAIDANGTDNQNCRGKQQSRARPNLCGSAAVGCRKSHKVASAQLVR